MTPRISIVFGAAIALVLTGTAVAGVVKTKSNQSNDRIAHSEVAAAIDAAFDQCDLDKGGQLDSGEQTMLMDAAAKGTSDARGAPLKGVDIKIGRGSAARLLHVTFSADLDRDGNGQVSKREWLDDWQARFDLADGDHDSSLSEAEASKFGWNIKSTETR